MQFTELSSLSVLLVKERTGFDSTLQLMLWRASQICSIGTSVHCSTGEASGRRKTIPSHRHGTKWVNQPKNKTNLDKSLRKWLTELTNVFRNGTNFKQGLTVSWWVGILSSNCSCWEIFPVHFYTLRLSFYNHHLSVSFLKTQKRISFPKCIFSLNPLILL